MPVTTDSALVRLLGGIEASTTCCRSLATTCVSGMPVRRYTLDRLMPMIFSLIPRKITT